MKPHPHVLILLSWLLVISCFSPPAGGMNNSTISNHSDTKYSCISHEREALLQFKHHIQIDNCGLLDSWTDHGVQRDCCQWRGVHCSNRTGYILVLDLRGIITSRDPSDRCLQGKLSPSLVELKQLEYLDLSLNNFQGQPIPIFIGSLFNLKHLNFSNAGFDGEIPHQLGNLSKLASLDLSVSYYHSDLNIKNLGWLSRLTLLRDIDLTSVDLGQATDFFHVVTNLPLLRVLHADDCNLSPPILSSLSYLNSSTALAVVTLADNPHFTDTSIFQWLFNFTAISSHLVHVDLHHNSILGPFPSAFGNMHALSYLNLSGNRIGGLIPSGFGNNMHALSYLDLSGNQLGGPSPSSFGNMRAISYLDLSATQLECQDLPDTIANLKHLIYLDLSINNFQRSRCLPKALGNLCSLQTLSLSFNNMTDEFSTIIHALSGCAHKSLALLDLGYNQISGSIPNTISKFSSLRKLDIRDNKMNGTISQGFGKLSTLETLFLYGNAFQGNLSDNHFSNLSRLSVLDISNNPDLAVHVSSHWIPPFQLTFINMSPSKVGPQFPRWLLTQMNISYLDLSSGGISDTIPQSFWNSLSPNLSYLNLSNNNIKGLLPTDISSLVFTTLHEIDLSSNLLEGTIPSFGPTVSLLYLNNNLFTNATLVLCPKTKIMISNLDLSNNMISGQLPDCWTNFAQLSILRLENNNLSGILPTSIGVLRLLQVLHLRNNSFFGELPTSLENCTSLAILDVGYNSLTGQIPSRIGNTFKGIGILNLRSNNFYGRLPSSLCELSSLQILDLSGNRISGTIPDCINNLSAMANMTDLLPQAKFAAFYYFNDTYSDTALIMWKGRDQSFKKNLGLVKSIDISDNELEGHIPHEISSLKGLVSLDLSRNSLTGSITTEIGQLQSLEFLDLSSNHLSGQIPASLADLSYLGILDLSNNSLSGEIPTGTQLQRFDALAYMGNLQLCGPPLRKCLGDEPPAKAHHGNQDEDIDRVDDIFPGLGLYISVVLGFIIGFGGVCGTLVLNKSWRAVYVRYVDHVKETIWKKT